MTVGPLPTPTGDRAATEAAWLGLLSLPGVGPARCWHAAIGGGAVDAWRALLAGVLPDGWSAGPEVAGEWFRHAAVFDADGAATAHQAAGVSLTWWGDPGHPTAAACDPHVPPVLFWRRGGERSPGSPAVGVIGTRRATRVGLEFAHELGGVLASAGCDVVSGLALGIDAAAHRGALEVLGEASGGGDRDGSGAVGTVTGVVGSGLDVVYPRANGSLWHAVAEHGRLASEYPLGTPPAAWRFPARNRILVACCDAIVVVESRRRGGSLITAGLAGDRGVPVLAVPGSVRSPTAEGTNRLIADGCPPCLGVDDVLTAVGLTSTSVAAARSDAARVERPRVVDEVERAVLDALGWSPMSFDDLSACLPSVDLGSISVSVQALVARGLAVSMDGQVERLR